MLLGGNYDEYLDCSTKFDKEYNLVSITHHVKFNNSDFYITL